MIEYVEALHAVNSYDENLRYITAFRKIKIGVLENMWSTELGQTEN